MTSPNPSSVYATDIQIGDRYRDEQTGIEGTATVVSFYQYGCERVSIEAVVNGEIKDYGFDAPRLTHVDSGARAETRRTGGPARGADLTRGAVSR